MHKTQSVLNTGYSLKHVSQHLGKPSIYLENEEVEIEHLYHSCITFPFNHSLKSKEKNKDRKQDQNRVAKPKIGDTIDTEKGISFMVKRGIGTLDTKPHPVKSSSPDSGLDVVNVYIFLVVQFPFLYSNNILVFF